ncbi:sulfite exporter TauE/SafE family protein [Microvirga arsenatis]|uniref:Probable membrane transporter protein n=1 Tax=Microvirga arsenatis TaxID=2692265 RepID=A0ABW9YXT7_9HYPH|nr:sulfite exporter TauE/SafE family protein [Microvirga arsenatis]NBJ11714.1 TSUP family transporter [Microvirga arsenatis]NBJ24995.1 TSUP family transporter [Microvirga arsenatis]
MTEHVSLLQYGLVALCALLTGTIGGIAGYGTGLLMPLVLVPIVGAEPVVPIIGLSALFTNASRIMAFRKELDARRALLIGGMALPTCMLGAYGYAFLTGRGAAITIGTFLILMVPTRLYLKRRQMKLSGGALAAAGAGYGLLVGGTAGSGVVLLSILMASGLNGRAVIATDAAISLALGVAKSGVFQVFGALPSSSWVMAAIIGLAATPGAFIAKRLTEALPIHIHNTILDAAIVCGGVILVVQGLR